jgi:hypothetical protein
MNDQPVRASKFPAFAVTVDVVILTYVGDSRWVQAS